jgi:hypothetical protein
VSFVAITLCAASQRAIPKVSVYFVINSVRKFLDTLSCHEGNIELGGGGGGKRYTHSASPHEMEDQ